MYFEPHRSEHNGQWYWRLKADNGRTIADGAEGYNRRADCIHGINLVKQGAASAPIRGDELGGLFGLGAQ